MFSLRDSEFESESRSNSQGQCALYARIIDLHLRNPPDTLGNYIGKRLNIQYELDISYLRRHGIGSEGFRNTGSFERLLPALTVLGGLTLDYNDGGDEEQTLSVWCWLIQRSEARVYTCLKPRPSQGLATRVR